MYISTENFLKKLNPNFSDYSIDYISEKLRHIGFYPISDKAIKQQLKDSNFTDFIYWKRGEAILLDVTRDASHQIILYALACVDHAIEHQLQAKEAFNAVCDEYDFDRFSKIADAFITNKLGFFMSSVSDKITISEDYKMTATEKRIFNHFERKTI